MMITGMCGKRALTLDSRVRPDSPGMRMSESSTRGAWEVPSSAASTSPATEALVRNLFPRQGLLQHPADRAVVINYPDCIHVIHAHK
jgi:hypothetical protein